MNLIHEIHNQRPVIRHTLFGLSMVIAASAVVYFSVSSIQKDIFFAMHTGPDEQTAYLERRDAGRPKPLAAIAKAAGSLTASIGSLIGWDRDAGFDRGGEQDNTQGGVHLLPLAD